MPRPAPARLAYPLLLGLYLTAHGYHSRDGDQAYRLPILLHLQDHRLFADDPFVRAFDDFNPHRGYLALLDLASRPFGLSTALFALFVATFALSVVGIRRLARSAWPDRGEGVGVMAVALVLLAQAGNIGTNHLFEATLLDRLLALSLGWLALSEWVSGSLRSSWVAPPLLGFAAWIHPSMGLQLAMLLSGAWAIDLGLRRRDLRSALVFPCLLAACFAPTIRTIASQGNLLFRGLSADEFRLLSAFVQSPQHMIPHLWRAPQWLAWGCYPVLASMALFAAPRPWPEGRRRLAILVFVNLLGLAMASIAIEGLHDLRVTVFQPFRLATVLRGLCLVLVSDRILMLWSGDFASKTRAVLLAAGLIGDWTMAAATIVEIAATIAPRVAPAVLVGVLVFLARHDTESGHVRLLLAIAGLAGFVAISRLRPFIGSHAPRYALPPRQLLERIAGWHAHPGRVGACRRSKTRPGWACHPANDSTRSAICVIDSAPRGNAPFDAPRRPGSTPLEAATTASRRRGRGASRTAFPRGAWERGEDSEPQFTPSWNRRRASFAMAAAWALPLAAIVTPCVIPEGKIAESLTARWRFGEHPVGDLERLAVWCRSGTPSTAKFLGPPGPKGFRLWSRRSLAFNRAGSPYHAAGLADWSARFRDHVGYQGSTSAFAAAYLADRHGLEHRFDELDDDQMAALARRQGADHILKARPNSSVQDGPLELLHVDGRYAVYRVRSTSYPAASLANASH